MKTLLIVLAVVATVMSIPTEAPVEEPTTTWWDGLEENQPRNGEIIMPDAIEDLHLTRDFEPDFTETVKLTGKDNLLPIYDPGCDGPGTVCVPYFQCGNGSIITDGSGLIDIRFGNTIIGQHKNCQRYLEVCCRKTNSTLPPTTTQSPHVPTCGQRNPNGVHARITGLNNTQTQFGEFPWMVAILRIENIGGKDINLYLCGGSLIRPNIVLTAGHCVSGYGPESLKVRAGEWDTQSEYELLPHQDRFVNTTIIHPSYNGGSLWNDFAILILKTPFTLAPNVDTLCLPQPTDSFKGVPCIATGWGKDKFGTEGRFQNVLKQVTLTVVPHGVCENALRTTRLGENFILDKSFVCAGGMQEVDTCKGDGGSPLVCPLPGSTESNPTYYQAGIVAWGIGCGENGIPGVYADVVNGTNWIQDSISPYI